MNDDNYIVLNEEGIAEINPTASFDKQNAFIDNYRQIQGENTAQIGTQTHALGSDLAAPYGGLHGPSEYMKSRYQTPQTESRVAAMRTAAQLSALNQLMQNDQNRWNERYNQAYRNAQKRQRARQNALYGGGGGGDGVSDGDGLNITTSTGEPGSIDVNMNPNVSGNNLIQTGENTYKNLATGETYSPAGTAFMSTSSQGMSLGVWPDGSRMTIGSTYTAPNGNTYTYQQTGNMDTPSVFLVAGNTYGQQSGGNGG